MIVVDGLARGHFGQKLVDGYDIETPTTSDIQGNPDSLPEFKIKSKPTD